MAATSSGISGLSFHTLPLRHGHILRETAIAIHADDLYIAAKYGLVGAAEIAVPAGPDVPLARDMSPGLKLSTKDRRRVSTTPMNSCPMISGDETRRLAHSSH